tara:strand:+ start:1491 stop:2675 length:1185 start_codon:yes stop_codon:yes gene_type:complete
MLFQTLDDKKECVGVFYNGELQFKEVPPDLSKTWSYSNFLNDRDIEYASLYCGGKTLDQVCPSHLVDDWERVSNKLKAFIRSNKIAKVNLSEICFFDVTPARFLMEYCQVKSAICEWIFEKYPRPDNYDHLVEVQKVLSDIKYQPINLDLKPLQKHWGDRKARSLFSRFANQEKAYVDYNLFGSVTGRLTLTSDSYPLLNLKKEYRETIKPNNDFLLELDYNAAEARVVLSLLGLDQPSEDIHDYHAKNLYHTSRDEAKKRFFAWLYNPNSEDTISSGQYDRDKLLGRHRIYDSIETLFKRKIKCDDFHAFNYLIQSTCADMVLDRMCAIHKLLQGRKSFVAFTLHDSIILDFSVEDKDLIKEIISTYRQTKLGNFKTTVSAGRDLYNLNKINI